MKNNTFQLMRGICIIAVVLTHIIDKNISNPNYEIALVIQNIVNIAVTGFIFLAGYFINIEEVKTNAKHFIIRKSKRILIPYILWTIFYMLFNIILQHQHYGFGSLVKAILLGQASAPLYYCILYLLFILITPFVVKKMEYKIWNIIFYSIMPVWFVGIYYFRIKHQISFPNMGVLPFAWFLYFYMGLRWRDISIRINIVTIIVLIFVGYFLESVEACWLFSTTGITSFSVTPVRLSTILYVIPILLIFLKLKNIKQKKSNVFVSLGNNSFGIFLSHMIILFCVKYIANNIFNTIHLTSIHYIFYIITVLFVTILTTNILINICKKFMPNNFLNWVGFI